MRPVWAVSLEGGPRRVNHSAVMIQHRIFMFGGYCSGDDYETETNIDVYIFNTISFCWRKVKPRLENVHTQNQTIPYMRYGHSSVAIGERAYLFGGRNDYHGACKILFYYDTEKLVWFTPQVSGHLPGARDGHAMCVARGNIYMYGGYEAEIDQYSEDTFKLDMKTMQWSLLITMGNHGIGMWRDFHTFTAHKDKIYLFGGRGDLFGPHLSNSEFYDDKIKILDLDTLTWSTPATPRSGEEVPMGRRSHTAFFHKGCMYVFGGYNSEIDEHFNDLWKFNPGTGIWSEVSTSGKKPCARRRHCCCYSNNRVFIFGGTSPFEIETNGTEIKRTRTDTVLYDHSDTYMLDLEPSLKTLCILAVKKYNLDISCLPLDIIRLHHSMTSNNGISKSWPSSKG